MRKLLPYLLLAPFTFCFGFSSILAQRSTNYATTTGTTSSLITDKNGNNIDFSTISNTIANNSQATAALMPIGFDFVFMGKVYTHFVIGANGQIALGVVNSPNSITSNTVVNDLTRVVSYPPLAANAAPVLAPFWDALRTSATGPAVKTITTGTSPSRCRIVQWSLRINVNSTTSVSGGDGTFQARLYENTGEVEYVYGNMKIGSSSTTVTASIGFTAGTQDSSFMALQNLSSFSFTTTAANEPATQSLVNSSDTGIINGLHSPTEGSRRFFRFTPPTLSGSFININITELKPASMRLNWTDTFTNEAGYIIYASIDNINFSAVKTLPANSNTYLATPLSHNTRHYWKVTAYTEGSIRTSDTISDSTSCNMQGTYSIGPAGNFNSLKQAFDSLNEKGVTGDIILELQSDYSSVNETFPLAVPQNIQCRSEDFKIIIRPAVGATNITIENNTASSLLIIDATNNITLDGRPGGIGNSKALTLSSGGTVIDLRSSSNNTLQYLNIRSGFSGGLSGAVSLRSISGEGCDNNIITNCNIYDNGTTPRVLIYSTIISGGDNSNNQVTYCNLYNFKTMGVYLSPGSVNWQIKGNSFYATQPIMSDSAIAGMIVCNDLDFSGGHLIEGNYFGGSATGATGNVMQVTGTRYEVISTQGNANLKGNYIKRLVLKLNATTYSQSRRLIYIGKPGFTSGIIDSVTNNIIGGSNIADSVTVYNTASYLYDMSVIEATSQQDVLRATGNSIQNVAIRSNAGAGSVNFTVIKASYNSNHASNNNIGNLSGGYNIRNYTSAATIAINMGGYSMTANNNSIAGIAGNATVEGILAANYTGGGESAINISGNTIARLTTTLNNAGGYFYNILTGIEAVAWGSGIIKSNTIYDLSATSATGISKTIGIYSNGSSATPFITGNFIHSLYSTASLATGIDLVASYSTVTNNMIRLGLDTAGNTIVNNGTFSFNGISQDMYSSNKLYHNTIHITGTTPDTASSAAISYSGLLKAYNNIITIHRSVADSAVTHNYVLLPDAGSATASGTFDYNIYHYQGAGTIFSNSPSATSFASWQQQTGNDTHSTIADPNYVNGDGTASAVNLHLASPTPAEAKGTTLYTTNADIDDETRSSLSPVDIGADAANFVLKDNWAPVLLPDSIPNQPVNIQTVVKINITDDTGVDTTPPHKPAMWFRKFYPDTTSWQNVPGTLTTGNTGNGKWQFTIDYTVMGLTPATGDSIECYFAAQDITTFKNIGYAPLLNYNHDSVNLQKASPYQTYHYKLTDSVLVEEIPPATLPDTSQDSIQITYVNAFAPVSKFTNPSRNAIDSASSPVVELVHFTYAPNPTTGTIKVSFSVAKPTHIAFVVTNNAGVPVYRSVPVTQSGKISKTIDLQGNKSGLYYIQIITGTTVTTKKIMLVN